MGESSSSEIIEAIEDSAGSFFDITEDMVINALRLYTEATNN